MYEIGRTHEAYVIPAEEKNTVYKLDDSYYVKAVKGDFDKSYELAEVDTFLSPAAYTFVKDSDYLTPVYCRIDISPSDHELKKTGILNTLNILDSVEASQFDLKRAQPVGKVCLPDWKNRYGNTYVITNGQTSRNPTSLLLFPFLPVTAVLDSTFYLQSGLQYCITVLPQGGSGSCNENMEEVNYTTPDYEADFYGTNSRHHNHHDHRSQRPSSPPPSEPKHEHNHRPHQQASHNHQHDSNHSHGQRPSHNHESPSHKEHKHNDSHRPQKNEHPS